MDVARMFILLHVIKIINKIETSPVKESRDDAKNERITTDLVDHLRNLRFRHNFLNERHTFFRYENASDTSHGRFSSDGPSTISNNDQKHTYDTHKLHWFKKPTSSYWVSSIRDFHHKSQTPRNNLTSAAPKVIYDLKWPRIHTGDSERHLLLGVSRGHRSKTKFQTEKAYIEPYDSTVKKVMHKNIYNISEISIWRRVAVKRTKTLICFLYKFFSNENYFHQGLFEKCSLLEKKHQTDTTFLHFGARLRRVAKLTHFKSVPCDGTNYLICYKLEWKLPVNTEGRTEKITYGDYYDDLHRSAINYYLYSDEVSSTMRKKHHSKNATTTEGHFKTSEILKPRNKTQSQLKVSIEKDVNATIMEQSKIIISQTCSFTATDNSSQIDHFKKTIPFNKFDQISTEKPTEEIMNNLTSTELITVTAINNITDPNNFTIDPSKMFKTDTIPIITESLAPFITELTTDSNVIKFNRYETFYGDLDFDSNEIDKTNNLNQSIRTIVLATLIPDPLKIKKIKSKWDKLKVMLSSKIWSDLDATLSDTISRKRSHDQILTGDDLILKEASAEQTQFLKNDSLNPYILQGTSSGRFIVSDKHYSLNDPPKDTIASDDKYATDSDEEYEHDEIKLLIKVVTDAVITSQRTESSSDAVIISRVKKAGAKNLEMKQRSYHENSTLILETVKSASWRRRVLKFYRKQKVAVSIVAIKGNMSWMIACIGIGAFSSINQLLRLWRFKYEVLLYRTRHEEWGLDGGLSLFCLQGCFEGFSRRVDECVRQKAYPFRIPSNVQGLEVLTTVMYSAERVLSLCLWALILSHNLSVWLPLLIGSAIARSWILSIEKRSPFV